LALNASKNCRVNFPWSPICPSGDQRLWAKRASVAAMGASAVTMSSSRPVQLGSSSLHLSVEVATTALS
jgi:hypothetical protein